jgi:rhamnosyltransferase
LGRSLYNTNHSAKRRYYITRNRLILMKRYLYKDPEWVKYDLSKMMQETLTLFFFERDRLTKSMYMMRAVFDAVFGRLGQRVPL